MTDVSQGPDRQSRRDRLPHHPNAAAHGRRARWPSTPRRTATRCTSRRPMRPCVIGPAAAAQSYLSVEAHPRGGASAPAPKRSIPATDSSARTRSSPRHAKRAGIVFIGPTPGADARVRAEAHRARNRRSRTACRCCRGLVCWRRRRSAGRRRERIGYPVMLKSTAGGGGIGMRSVPRREANCATPSMRCERLEPGEFGSAGVFLEKFVEQARHIEVQIFGDGAGQVVALGERDCSAQRRNQKVIEETPAPGLRPRFAARCSMPPFGLGAAVKYRIGRHGRVHLRQRHRRVLLPGSEHAPAGGAWRDRRSHRHRPRRVDGAAGCRRVARRLTRASAAGALRSRSASMPKIPPRISSRVAGRLSHVACPDVGPRRDVG